MAWEVRPVRRTRPQTAQHYRLKARECRGVADAFIDPVAREHLLEIAGHYDMLADRLEHRGQVEVQLRAPKP